MATAAVDVEPNDQDCAVCHQHFTVPKLLHCGHLLCRQCLLSWLKAETEASCPLCRSIIMEPEDKKSGKSFEEFVDSLPTDLAMESLVESEKILSEDHPCQFCVVQVAKSLCITCGDFFCSGCALGHKRSTMSRHHTVEELSTLTAERLSSSRPFPCSSHSGEVCRVYCPTHGASMCVLCATTTHRQCAGVMELDTKVQEDCAALQDLSTTLSAEEAALEKAIRQQDHYLLEMERSITAAIADIDARHDLLESALRANRQRLKDLLHAALAGGRDTANGNKTEMLRRKGRLTTHNQAVQRVYRVTKPDVIDSMTVAMKAKVKDLHCGAELPGGAMDIPVPTLVMDSKVVLRLERELLELGDVKTQPAALLGQKGPPILRFHGNRGKNVVLSNSELTAEKTSQYGGQGIVMSRDAMQVNMLYEIRLDGTNKNYVKGADKLGVVTVSPDTITLPDRAEDLQSAVVLAPRWISVNGVKTDSSVGAALKKVDEGSRMGLMVDSDRTLHLYRVGSCEGEVTRRVPDPCFFMADMRFFWEKVTALPVQRIA